MPTYDYKCANCGSVFEAFHGMNETPELTCPACGSRSVSKQIGLGAGIIFKGSGFYVTDYKKNGDSSSTATATTTTANTTTEKNHTCSGACSH